MLFSKTTRTFRSRISKDVIRSASSSTVGFIGLGNMGIRMAKNLISKGEKLIVYDVLPEAREKFTPQPNVMIANNLKDVANESSFIISMLPNCETVRAVYMNEDGIFKHCSKSDATFIDSSTIDPSLSQELFRTAKEIDCSFLDAPVSGGVMGAEKGSLAFMVGGCDKIPTNVESLLLKMGARVIHCGSSGMGQVAKLCNNMLLGATMVATAEAYHAALKCGINAQVLTSIINSSSGRCWVTEMNNPIPGMIENAPSTRDYRDGFKTSLLLKDLNLGLSMANSKGVDLALIKKTLQLYEEAASENERVRDSDFSIIYQALAKRS